MEDEYMNQDLYYPDGSLVSSKKDFLDFYSKLYYWKNSKLVEDRMIELYLKDYPLENEDIFDILAWKTGKIKHYQSQKEYQIKYYKGWKKQALLTDIYSQSFDIPRITNILKTIRDNHCPKNYVDAFKHNNTGIGPVYMITLMSFNTHGKELMLASGENSHPESHRNNHFGTGRNRHS